MFKHILVCCDESESSLQAAQIAASIAQKRPCRVTVLYVLNLHQILPPPIGAWEGEVGPEAVTHYRERVREVVKQPVAEIFRAARVDYAWRFELGHPVDKILDVAKEGEVDLIVLGSRGLGGLKRLVLGSVSEGTLHHAPCSVLIVRGQNAPQGAAGFEHILLAADGSESADRATLAAVGMAQAFNTSLQALHVLEPFSFSPFLSDDDYAVLIDQDPETLARHYRTHLRDSIGTVVTEANICCKLTQERGEAGDTIVGFANENRSDLIVMGSRGLGGFDRMLLGSVSTYVPHPAPCPVLIVR